MGIGDGQRSLVQGASYGSRFGMPGAVSESRLPDSGLSQVAHHRRRPGTCASRSHAFQVQNFLAANVLMPIAREGESRHWLTRAKKNTK